MDLTEWAEAFYENAVRTQDVERQNLVKLLQMIWIAYEANPSQATALINKGHLLAEKLNEKCWELLFQYCQAELVLFSFVDIPVGLDLAVKLVVEARKPVYLNCPVRSAVCTTLVSAYLYSDPVGYEHELRELLSYIEQEFSLDSYILHDVNLRRAILEAVCGNLEQAQTEALDALANANDELLLVNSYIALCEIAQRRKTWDLGLEYAQLGEKSATDMAENIQRTLIQFKAWQALFALHLGDLPQAERQYEAAARFVSLKQVSPHHTYLGLLSDYHEKKGELEKALSYRRQELQEAIATGSIFAECDCRVNLCRLVGRLNLPLAEDLREAQASANKLRAKEKVEEQLTRIANGDFSIS